MSEVRTIFRGVHDGRAIWERWQDCEDIVERNKKLQAEPQKGDARLIGSIPNVIYEKWLNEEIDKGNVNLKILSKEMDEIVARKLKDPEWKWLRTDNPSNPFRIGWK